MSRNLICISRTLAAGGELIGRGVAAALDYAYVDEEVITLAAEKAHVDPQLVEQAEHRPSILGRLLDALATRPVFEAPMPEGVYYLATAEPLPVSTGDDLRALIREAVLEIAARGRAVIVAHAASYALGPRRDVLRVLVTASPHTRADRLAAAHPNLDARAAARAVRDADKDRVHYLRTFYSVTQEQAVDYDLVINTDTLTIDEAVATVLTAAR